MTHPEDTRLDEYEKWLQNWDSALLKLLSGTEYALFWATAAPDDNPHVMRVGDINDKALASYQAYVDSRLRRLDYIFNDLRQS